MPDPVGLVGVELIEADLDVTKLMFKALDEAAKVEGVRDLRISFRLEGGNLITVGYGEQAEPAILAIQPYPDTGRTAFSV